MGDHLAGLRSPKPFYERVKLPLILVAYVAASEWASPFPFRVSFPARLAVFALALLVGIVSGTYSSIFNASQIVSLWQELEDRVRHRATAAA